MRVKCLVIIITTLFSLLFPNFVQAQRPKVVVIPDKNLAAAVRQEIGNSITTLTLLNLTRLEVPNRGIKNLSGLEHARNLEELNLGSKYIDGQGTVNNNKVSNFLPIARLTNLRRLNLSHCSVSDVSFLAKLTQLRVLYLYNNPISDISPLAGSTQLTFLDLSRTTVSDMSPLAGLTELRSLYLFSTSVSDVSALSGLTHLTRLGLSYASISDVSPLATLTQLTYLHLGNNSISDISPLANLTQLTVLYLWGNAISDISALSGLRQLTTLGLSNNGILDMSPLVRLDLSGTEWDSTGLYIGRNPLNYASINRHIPAMQAKGVEVEFTNRIPTTPTKILGIAQQGVVNTTLPLPFVVEVLDAENLPFAGVPVKFAVTAGSGKLSATTVRTDATGKASTYLRLPRAVGATTVRVTVANISQPVQFIATATLRSSPVPIPDINLRGKIAETLGKPLSESLTVADMLKLRTLTANNADIIDLTGLQHASNLTSLTLNNNRISNVSILAGLAHLATLDLRNNRISDVSPLVGLAQLRGPKDWDALYLQGNPLSDTTIRAHIPVLQAAGVNVHLDNISTQAGPIVRLVYFLPRDRQPQPDINAKMDRLIKDVQQFYEKQMENHGFGRKTFQFEADAHGNAVVYHINGKFDDTYYRDESGVVWREINEQFDTSKGVYLTALDISTEVIGTGEDNTACGTGGGGSRGGRALIPASGNCFHISTTAHELGHAFGLHHDFSSNTYLMSYGSQNTLSQCAAEWLEVHRAFSPNQITSDIWATIEMLPPRLASPPNSIRFRFKVNEPDGLHQAQLHTQTLSGLAAGAPELVAYKRLNGNSNNTVNLVTSYLLPKNKLVTLRVIDVHGNISKSKAFPVDVPSLLPPSKVVSIPDPNLAAAIREEIGDSITTHALLNLRRLDARNRGITDLTGLEHAHNLRELDLGGEYIDGKGHVNSNAVSNFSPLAKLTNLNTLNLNYCSISDVSFLAGLTQLTSLRLSNNPITDAAPLARLTQLMDLDLSSTSISDVSPLAGLTQLRFLWLFDISVSDISALSSLTQLTRLSIAGTSVSDLSPLAGLTQLTFLDLSVTSGSDISGLAGLTQLISLYLIGNNLSDISALSGLRQLTTLGLSNNDILDISALSELTQLTRLDLGDNDISDVSPLVGLNLTGTNWDNTGLFINRNPLSYTSINTHIPAMQAKGVEVKFDRRTPKTLVKISGAAQQGIANSELPLPFVVEVRDDRNLAFAGVPVTFAITAGRGRLSNTTVTTDTTGRAETHLTLGRTADTTAVRVTAREISQSVQFTAAAIRLSAPVVVTDVALRTEIISALGNQSRNEPLTVSDMLKLTTLTATDANIRDLTGLQHATNLTALSLNNNNLYDIAPIAGLSQLTTLSLNGNRISDVTPLAALAQLQTLSLENNDLSDVTPLSGLTQLKTLLLDNNRLWNVSALTRLSGLKTLSLNNNDLSDVAPLISLTQLKTLQLRGNLLSYPALHTHVPAIQARGPTVVVDPRTPTTLVKVSDTHGVTGAALPVIVEVQDEQGLGFSGVPVTFTVTAGGGRLSAPKVITDITGRARTTLTLGATPGKNTVRTTAVEVRRPTLFAITAINANSRVAVRDANLRAKIVQALNKPVSAQLTAGDMLALTKLDAPNANIQNLTGLEHAHNLKELYLGGEYIEGKGTVNSNTISDFSPVAGLIQLTQLNLSSSSISDVSFLSGWTHLKGLILYDNPISDISSLVGLTQLTSLELSSTVVSDISPLVGLTQLSRLYLYNTSISDISALSNLTELTGLGIGSASVSDVSPLVGLTQLSRLYLYNTSISDISALSNLTELTGLDIGGASVSDVSPLAALTQLVHLNLGWNAISDISALARLTQLKNLTLSGNTITDVSALSGLTQLTTLKLRDNAIMDVSPLVGLDLKGTQWDPTGLSIERNPLSYASINTHISAMQAKGIKVRYDLDLAKIIGPWLWMIAPTEPGRGGARAINVDSLAAVSAGAVTEAEVAVNGAKDGDSVGNYIWSLGRIAGFGGNNINDLLNSIGMAKGDINDHSSYALIMLESATAQSDVTMKVGSDDAIKVWLNGEVVHNNPVDRGAGDFQDDFTVDLEKGDNLLLVKVSERAGDWSMFVGIEADVNAVYKRPPDDVVSADVNGDGVVNIQDLVLVSSNFGQTGQSRADVNGDGVVNISDLVLVASAFGEGAAAAPTLHPSDLEGITAAEIQDLLTQARQMALTDPAYLRGIAVLEQLLTLLLPKETALLANYPNPFNPETWIPYHLSKPAEVTLHIYSVNGALVRTLVLGHQTAGKYQTRTTAAHWDGRNAMGETVASGIYFYTLTAGDFTATRKMLIRK